jgi:hypothetical protein
MDFNKFLESLDPMEFGNLCSAIDIKRALRPYHLSEEDKAILDKIVIPPESVHLLADGVPGKIKVIRIVMEQGYGLRMSKLAVDTYLAAHNVHA